MALRRRLPCGASPQSIVRGQRELTRDGGNQADDVLRNHLEMFGGLVVGSAWFGKKLVLRFGEDSGAMKLLGGGRPRK